MSKKFLTLIYGDQLHIAPETKVVPADQFSKLVSAEELLQKIEQEAERYREEVAAECVKLKEQAKKEGFEEGFSTWSGQVAKLEQEIARVQQDVEKMVAPVALKAAKKIVGRELEVHPEVIVDIVSSVLKSVSQHRKILIYVNKADLDLLENEKAKIKTLFENLESLSIRARDDVKQGGCVIETEAGIINAQLENQWQILERAFESLAKQKKGET